VYTNYIPQHFFEKQPSTPDTLAELVHANFQMHIDFSVRMALVKIYSVGMQ